MENKLENQVAFLDSQIALREKEIAKVDACELELEGLKAELEELKLKVAGKQEEFDSVKEDKAKYVADVEILKGIKESLLPKPEVVEEAEAVEEVVEASEVEA